MDIDVIDVIDGYRWMLFSRIFQDVIDGYRWYENFIFPGFSLFYIFLMIKNQRVINNHGGFMELYMGDQLTKSGSFWMILGSIKNQQLVGDFSGLNGIIGLAWNHPVVMV
jgi:hypothetical protein